MLIQNCGNCKFRPETVCKRFPPAFTLHATDKQHPIAYETLYLQPYVDENDWCGEHKYKMKEYKLGGIS